CSRQKAPLLQSASSEQTSHVSSPVLQRAGSPRHLSPSSQSTAETHWAALHVPRRHHGRDDSASHIESRVQMHRPTARSQTRPDASQASSDAQAITSLPASEESSSLGPSSSRRAGEQASMSRTSDTMIRMKFPPES